MDNLDVPVVTLPPRSTAERISPIYMPEKPEKNALAVVALVLGFLSFVPLLGLGAGPLAVLLGFIARWLNGGSKIALAGIVLGIVGFSTLLLFYSGTYLGPQVQAYRIQQAQGELAKNAVAIEMYKQQIGSYPDSLETVQVAGISVVMIDPFLRGYFYARAGDGSSFELKSIGPDRILDTADDILYLR